MVAPSTHPSGERVEWEAFGEPAQVDGAVLRRCVTLLAAATLVARHWPCQGSRHHASMALSRVLLEHGLSVPEAQHFIRASARVAGDEEADDRAADVASTSRRLMSGAPATGEPTVAELMTSAVAARLDSWLRRVGNAPRPGVVPGTEDV